MVVEYISGGGFNKDALPDGLVEEGLLMLEALLKSLQGIDGIELMGMIDKRLVDRLKIKEGDYKIIEPEHSFEQEFKKLLQSCDAVWPIAPESDGILQGLCEAVGRSGKTLLNSPASAVSIAGDKWLTYGRLRKHSIPCVETHSLQGFEYPSGEWVIKLADGVGCENSYIVRDKVDFDKVVADLNQSSFIIQPHLEGEKTSLSGLFKKGQGWLICANRQHFEVIDHRYHLTGITVNYTPFVSYYTGLLSAIAQAMPDLWGYVGVDLIETQGKRWVLEINPRLTSSFVGIDEACSINCAQSVFGLLTENPCIHPDNNKPVYINLQH